jgi:hypothetical protein
VTKGLDKVFEIMNHEADVEWRLVIVGPDREVAEFARDHLNITGVWERIPVYACQLPLGTIFTEFDVQQLWANLNEVTMV